MTEMKIAFTGTSGSGKTTLVKYLHESLEIPHISGSAGDVHTKLDQIALSTLFEYDGGGHSEVIKKSAHNLKYGLINQLLLQIRRSNIISENSLFVTDRSPVDNMTYFVNQVGFHKEVTRELMDEFLDACIKAWNQLTHVIYVKPCQPGEVENNGSRIANKYYQKAIDAQFDFWIREHFIPNTDIVPGNGPAVLIIDFWDLELRKKLLTNFITNNLPGIKSLNEIPSVSFELFNF